MVYVILVLALTVFGVAGSIWYVRGEAAMWYFTATCLIIVAFTFVVGGYAMGDPAGFVFGGIIAVYALMAALMGRSEIPTSQKRRSETSVLLVT